MTRKIILSLILVVGLLLNGASQASAAPKFPERVVEIIVPAGAGGGSDAFARALGIEISAIFGVPVNVLNIPGASEAIGLQELINRPADGYTLMTTTTTHITEAALGNRPNFSAVEGIALFHEDVYGLHVKADSKWKTIEDFIADAKAKPGQLIVGGQYPMSLDELVLRKLENAIGIELNYIPYDSAGQFLADVLGGHIDMIIDEYSVVKEVLEAGQIRSLLTVNKERLAQYPDIPTTVEKGWNVTDGLIRGLLIKSDTPAEIKAVWEETLKKAYDTDNYQKFCEERLLKFKEAYTDAKGYNELMGRQVGEFKAIIDELKK